MGEKPLTVFVTGATGVLGRPVLRRLTADGHRVKAVARSAANDALLGELGAVPVNVDIFDRRAVEPALAGCHAVLHLATRIPQLRAMGSRDAWRENDRLRAEATQVLVDAALAAGVSAFVYPSVCFFYPDAGDDWIEAAEPFETPDVMRSTLVAEAEVARFTAAGGRGLTLRMAGFYGVDVPSTAEMLAVARRGVSPVIGRPRAYQPLVWADDAAAAVVAALLEAPAGVYDVVDDEPLTRGELVPLIAAAAGRQRLVVPPVLLARLAAGKDATFAARSQRVSNRRLRSVTGWQPQVRDAREGWRRIAEELVPAVDA
ncbi:MAG TPA: NAD-dependent epimerase/dehydratase family protein [Longimicrobiales bacterium]|nr:NAD-dependent epimerase/dehydratase family protein [Longimicrobiales bacterium]